MTAPTSSRKTAVRCRRLSAADHELLRTLPTETPDRLELLPFSRVVRDEAVLNLVHDLHFQISIASPSSRESGEGIRNRREHSFRWQDTAELEHLQILIPRELVAAAFRRVVDGVKIAGFVLERGSFENGCMGCPEIRRRPRQDAPFGAPLRFPRIKPGSWRQRLLTNGNRRPPSPSDAIPVCTRGSGSDRCGPFVRGNGAGVRGA